MMLAAVTVGMRGPSLWKQFVLESLSRLLALWHRQRGPRLLAELAEPRTSMEEAFMTGSGAPDNIVTHDLKLRDP
jgi:hypothetical protein